MTGQSASQQVRWRLAVPCTVFMLMSSLDRANISFAATTMNPELGFTPSQYGFGASVLFIGFLAGQLPSLWLLQRVGMRRWIASCALLWGLAAAAMGFIHTPMQFYVLRVLIGLAEGGLAPGIVLYLSQFATEGERARTFTFPMLAIPLSVVLGAPLSGVLLDMGDGLGMQGWRFMFVAEAVPTVVLGLLAASYFPDTPAQARWLSPEQRQWLAAHAARRAPQRERNDWSALLQPVVVLSGLLWFMLLSGSYGLIFWLPQVMHALTGMSATQLGLLGALPWVCVAYGMYWNATHSDRTGERYWHVALPALLTAVALAAAWGLGAGGPALLALMVAGFGLGCAQGAFWALPTRLMSPAAFSVGVVVVNIAGSAGGMVMPALMGIARERTGGFGGPTALVVVVMAAAALLVAAIALQERRQAGAARQS